jgi:hypothetical protein
MAEFMDDNMRLFDVFKEDYPNLKFNDALEEYLYQFKPSKEQKEDLSEKEIDKLKDVRDRIRKKAYHELNVIMTDIKYYRNIIKNYLELSEEQDMSKSLIEELNQLLHDTKFNMDELGNLPTNIIEQIFVDLEDDLIDIEEEYKDELKGIEQEDIEFREDQNDMLEDMKDNLRKLPYESKDINNDMVKLDKEYQPYEYQPEQLHNFQLDRDLRINSWPSSGVEKHEDEDQEIIEQARIENDYYNGQILRLQQLILADPENKNNDHYIALLGALRQKIKENEGITHDNINYHIGPEDMGVEIFPYEMNNPLLNLPMYYQSKVNRRGFIMSRNNLVKDQDIQARSNRILIEAQNQFSPLKGFKPQVSKTLWDSMVDGKELGWAKSSQMNILGYNNGVYGRRFN